MRESEGEMQSVKSAERSRAETRPQKRTWVWDSNYGVGHFLRQLSLTCRSGKFQFICFYSRNSFQAARHTSDMCICVCVCVCASVHMCACVRARIYSVHYCMQLYKHERQRLWSERTDNSVSDCSFDTSTCGTSGLGHHTQICFHSISDQEPNSHLLKSFTIPQQWVTCLVIQADFGHMDRLLLFFQSFNGFCFLVFGICHLIFLSLNHSHTRKKKSLVYLVQSLLTFLLFSSLEREASIYFLNGPFPSVDGADGSCHGNWCQLRQWGEWTGWWLLELQRRR